MKDKKDSEILVTQIPLKVKKAKAPKKVQNKKNKKQKIELPVLKEDKLSLQFLSTIKVLTVIALLIVTVILITNIVIEIDKNNKSELIPKEEVKIDSNSIIGNWVSENESLFAFNDDGNFYWYDSKNDLTNNYYSGTYTYKTGKDALNEMGYTEEEVKVTFGDNIDINNIYSIVLQPKTLIKAQKDLSKEIKERETWWFLLIKKSDKEALGYNKTLDLRYKLSSN